MNCFLNRCAGFRVLFVLSVFGALCPVSAAEPETDKASAEGTASTVATGALAATPLADACEARRWSAVGNLLKQAGKDTPQPDGMTALHWAAYHGHLPTVNALLDAAVSKVDAINEYGVTPLSVACELGHAEIVERLCSAKANVAHTLPGKVTPVFLSAQQGSAVAIKHLIDHGAKVDAKEASGQTPLMWAAAAGHVDAVQALLEAGADKDASVPSGFTALLFATRQGHHEVVNVLIDAGVDPTHAMKPEKKFKRAPRTGSSALTLAIESGHFELAMYLIGKGADPNDQRSGFAPLHSLTWVRKPNRGEEPDGDPPPRGSGTLSSIEFIRALVAAGADVNLQLKKGKKGKAHLNRTGATPLLLAAKAADLPYIKLLVELGADPTTTNADGCTPLLAAAGVGVRAVGEEAGTEGEVLETMEYLVAHGNDVNVVDKNKETAMHGAAYRCYPKVVAFLAENGADPKKLNHRNVSGWTPRRIAEGYRPGSFKPDPATIAAIDAAMPNSLARTPDGKYTEYQLEDMAEKDVVKIARELGLEASVDDRKADTIARILSTRSKN